MVNLLVFLPFSLLEFELVGGAVEDGEGESLTLALLLQLLRLPLLLSLLRLDTECGLELIAWLVAT